MPNSEVIAMLPCAENQMSIVWSCAESKAKSLDKLDPAKVVEKINQVFNQRFETEFAEKVHETFRLGSGASLTLVLYRKCMINIVWPY